MLYFNKLYGISKELKTASQSEVFLLFFIVFGETIGIFSTTHSMSQPQLTSKILEIRVWHLLRLPLPNPQYIQAELLAPSYTTSLPHTLIHTLIYWRHIIYIHMPNPNTIFFYEASPVFSPQAAKLNEIWVPTALSSLLSPSNMRTLSYLALLLHSAFKRRHPMNVSFKRNLKRKINPRMN